MTRTGRQENMWNNFFYSPIHSARNGFAAISPTKEKRKMFTSPSLQHTRHRQRFLTVRVGNNFLMWLLRHLLIPGSGYRRVGTIGDFRLLFAYIVAWPRKVLPATKIPRPILFLNRSTIFLEHHFSSWRNRECYDYYYYHHNHRFLKLQKLILYGRLRVLLKFCVKSHSLDPWATGDYRQPDIHCSGKFPPTTHCLCDQQLNHVGTR